MGHYHKFSLSTPLPILKFMMYYTSLAQYNHFYND